jgi:hypothetical protein
MFYPLVSKKHKVEAEPETRILTLDFRGSGSDVLEHMEIVIVSMSIVCLFSLNENIVLTTKKSKILWLPIYSSKENVAA